MAATTETSNAALIRSAFDAINAHDLPALKQCWTAETVERFPMRTVVGADAIAEVFAGTFAAMPDLRIEIAQLVEDGENVFVRWHMSGTHTGEPWEGVAASGKRIELDGVDHFVVRDGRIVSNFVIFDQLQFARAVGLMPEDGTAADRAFKSAFALRQKVSRRGR